MTLTKALVYVDGSAEVCCCRSHSSSHLRKPSAESSLFEHSGVATITDPCRQDTPASSSEVSSADKFRCQLYQAAGISAAHSQKGEQEVPNVLTGGKVSSGSCRSYANLRGLGPRLPFARQKLQHPWTDSEGI